ncbi:hypothetical protein BDW22DRAFT_1351317 [Trametopsis cervina]|nr:hypothetical protein BDW22DRAFT_1351317 [Trametopsis cervina]
MNRNATYHPIIRRLPPRFASTTQIVRFPCDFPRVCFTSPRSAQLTTASDRCVTTRCVSPNSRQIA